MAKKYSRRKVSLEDERNIAIGCIVSDKFCRDFKMLIGSDMELIKSKYIRTIIGWGLEYYTKFEKASNESILEVFKAESRNIQDEDDVDLIESTLEDVNERYIEDGGKFDYEFMFARTEKYIRGRSLEENSDRVKGLVSQGKIEEAEQTHNDYERKEKADGSGLNVYKDMEAIDDMFEYSTSLFHIPGAFGEIVQEIAEDDLIMIGANSKRGKSWLCMQMANYAVQDGLKVALFTLEMKKKLFNKRIGQFIAEGSFKDLGEKYVPSFNKSNNIKYTKEKLNTLNARQVKRAYRLFDKQYSPGELHVFDSTTGGRSIDAIKATLENEKDSTGRGFDFVIIDQISLITGGKGKERRHVLEDNAIRLKTEICADMNIPVLTPVQFAKGALTTGGGEDTISESYGLFHNCSLLISLNQTVEEKERGLMRVTCSGRNNDYNGEVVLLQNLHIGKFIVDSRWKKDIPNYNEVISSYDYNDDDTKELEDL